MKHNLITSGCLLLTLMLQVSCGKEAKSRPASGSRQEAYQNEKAFSAREQLVLALKENKSGVFKQILFNNPAVNINEPVNHGDDTFLTLAIKNDNREVFDYLVFEKKDIINLEAVSRHPETFNMSPLLVATLENRPLMLNILIDRKAKINRLDDNGRSPLHHAIQKRLDEVAILLIKRNADIFQTDRQGRNAYTLALEVGSEPIIDYLHGLTQIHQGLVPDLHSVRNLILLGDAHMLSKIFSKHPDLVQKYEALDPVNLAMDISDDNVSFSTTRVLLAHGFSANGLSQSDRSPLLEAVIRDRDLVAEILLLNKADVNFLDNQGHSSLYYAIRKNNPVLVDKLRSFSAETNYKILIDVDGRKKTVKFNACKEARAVAKTLTLEKSIEDNLAIQRRLACPR